MKVAITGVAGQQGSYLAESLLREGHLVHGIARPSGDTARLKNLRAALADPKFTLHYGDITDASVLHTLAMGHYDEVYHLAAVTNVAQSFECPSYFFTVNAMSTMRLLEELRLHAPKTRLYFAATSEMFAANYTMEQQDECWPLHAASPYGAAKIAAHLVCEQYRRAYGMFIVNGIAFNNESPRRGGTFITQKLAQGVKQFKITGRPLTIATFDSYRDWHHTADTVEGMQLAMSVKEPDTYVFASGVARSVRDLAQTVCDYYEVSLEEAVRVDPSQQRPLDVPYLWGNPNKAEKMLGWSRNYDFKGLISEMCDQARVI